MSKGSKNAKTTTLKVEKDLNIEIKETQSNKSSTVNDTVTESKILNVFSQFMDLHFNISTINETLSTEDQYNVVKTNFAKLCDCETLIGSRRAEYIQLLNDLHEKFQKREDVPGDDVNDPDVDDELEEPADTKGKRKLSAKTDVKKTTAKKEVACVIEEEDVDAELEEPEVDTKGKNKTSAKTDVKKTAAKKEVACVIKEEDVDIELEKPVDTKGKNKTSAKTNVKKTADDDVDVEVKSKSKPGVKKEKVDVDVEVKPKSQSGVKKAPAKCTTKVATPEKDKKTLDANDADNAEDAEDDGAEDDADGDVSDANENEDKGNTTFAKTAAKKIVDKPESKKNVAKPEPIATTMKASSTKPKVEPGTTTKKNKDKVVSKEASKEDSEDETPAPKKGKGIK